MIFLGNVYLKPAHRSWSDGLFIYLFFVSFVVVGLGIAKAETREEKARLDKAMAFWESSLPFCEGFLSKEHSTLKTRPDGTSYYEPCDDGDTILFSGLTCAAGDPRGCAAVKASQSEDGRWWRSPKKRREKPPDGGSESTFSNDHAQGVWAYIAERKDLAAFKRWTQWIEKNDKALGFVPRYCEDNRCAFKFIDCPMLDRLAVRLETGNPICDAVPIPPLPIVDPSALAQKVVSLRKAFSEAEKLVKATPGGAVAFSNINPLKKDFDKLMRKMEANVEKLTELFSRIKVMQRVATDSAGVINRINALVNDRGFPRHNVVTKVFLLSKYGDVVSPLMSEAAAKVAAVDSENAYFEYIARGRPTDRMLSQIFKKCRTEPDKEPHPRFQWIWERADNDKKSSPADTMYWDCLFVARLYNSGPLKAVSFPLPRAFDDLFIAEQRILETTINEAEKVTAAFNRVVKKPNQRDAYTVVTAPGTMQKNVTNTATIEGSKIIGGAIGGKEGAKTAGKIAETFVRANPATAAPTLIEKNLPKNCQKSKCENSSPYPLPLNTASIDTRDQFATRARKSL